MFFVLFCFCICRTLIVCCGTFVFYCLEISHLSVYQSIYHHHLSIIYRYLPTSLFLWPFHFWYVNNFVFTYKKIVYNQRKEAGRRWSLPFAPWKMSFGVPCPLVRSGCTGLPGCEEVHQCVQSVCKCSPAALTAYSQLLGMYSFLYVLIYK